MEKEGLQDAVEESEQRRMLLVNRLKDAQDTLKVGEIYRLFLKHWHIMTKHFLVEGIRLFQILCLCGMRILESFPNQQSYSVLLHRTSETLTFHALKS